MKKTNHWMRGVALMSLVTLGATAADAGPRRREVEVVRRRAPASTPAACPVSRPVVVRPTREVVVRPGRGRHRDVVVVKPARRHRRRRDRRRKEVVVVQRPRPSLARDLLRVIRRL